jgi:hypothetical protein
MTIAVASTASVLLDDFFRKLWQSLIDSSRLEYELERERPSPEQPDPEAT